MQRKPNRGNPRPCIAFRSAALHQGGRPQAHGARGETDRERMVNRFLSSMVFTLDNFGAKALRSNEPKQIMVGPGGEAQANLVNGLRVKQLQKAPLNANGFLSRCQNWSVCQETVAYLVQGDALMTGPHDLSDGPELAVTETPEKAAEKHKAAEREAFADKLAKRPPPNPVERAEIEKARKRTKARAPRIALSIEDRRTGPRLLYPVSDAGSCRGAVEQRLRPSCGLGYACT